jgi:hypothetical protein
LRRRDLAASPHHGSAPPHAPGSFRSLGERKEGAREPGNEVRSAEAGDGVDAGEGAVEAVADVPPRRRRA